MFYYITSSSLQLKKQYNELIFMKTSPLYETSVTSYLGYQQCYVCGATAKQMSEPRGSLHGFIPKPGTLFFGLHPLHVEMSSLRWFCKNAFNQDFREPEARGRIHTYL